MNWIEALALLSGGLFAGVLLYTAAVAHPVRRSMGGPFALRNFLASLPRSDKMQPAFHVVCLACTIALVATEPTAARVAALAVMAPVLPLSVGLILPLNALLKADTLDPESAEAADLLARWGRLHAARALFGIGGFVGLTASVAGL